MNHFFAYLGRLKFIKRWGLMRSVVSENTQEHSYQVAIIAHSLGVIKNEIYGGNVNLERVTSIALYHDVSEVITGDLPTPVKYANGVIRDNFHTLEEDASKRLISFLPAELQETYTGYLMPEDCEEKELVHIADKICAYVKCLEELISGNSEFASAKKVIEDKVNEYAERAEVLYFLQHFVPSFTLTLDEMSE